MPFDHFNIIAGCYDRVGNFIIKEPLLGLLALSTSNLLLDAGGGTGRVAAALQDKVRDVIVADTSRGMLQRAAGKGLNVVNAQAESLPLPSGSIDRILMMDALHHMADQRIAASELWRVLAPGGRVLIVEPDIRRMLAKVIAISEKLLLMRSHFLPCAEIAALFASSEAKVESYFDEFNIFLVAEKARQR
jgi:ubiquinone/menaquinone biosynthesis C-methylase UbiE